MKALLKDQKEIFECQFKELYPCKDQIKKKTEKVWVIVDNVHSEVWLESFFKSLKDI